MKTAELKVGTKNAKHVKVPVQTAETVDEAISLARNDAKVLVRMFNRGYRIEAQEKSGARDKLAELRQATPALSDEEVANQIATIVREFDPTKVKARTGRSSGPKKVVMPTARNGKLSIDDFKAALAAAGVKVEFVTQEQADADAAAAANTPALAGATA